MYFAAAFLCLMPFASHAYIDPGTGSIALQMLIGGILASLFAIKLYWLRFKAWCTRLFRGKEG